MVFYPTVTSGAFSCLAVVLMMSVSSVLAADGKKLFEDKGCTACHGEDANTPLQEGYPKLAGQNAEYVLQQLKDIKAGSRANGLIPDTMKPVIDELNDDQMLSIAQYLGGLKWAGPTGKGPSDAPGAALYRTKTCIACHGKEGTKPILKGYPFIAGQDKVYLLEQMKDIGSKKRANGQTAAMQPVMHLVAEKEMAAIAEYLSLVK